MVPPFQYNQDSGAIQDSGANNALAKRALYSMQEVWMGECRSVCLTSMQVDRPYLQLSEMRASIAYHTRTVLIEQPNLFDNIELPMQ